MNNAVMVSGGQQRDSAMHACVPILKAFIDSVRAICFPIPFPLQEIRSHCGHCDLAVRLFLT